MCHGGCGAILTIRNGRLVDIAGDRESLFSKGALCPKGRATVELVNHPGRVLHPLKRIGARGEGRWQEISWDQALDEICRGIDDVRRRTEPWSIALGQGTGRHHYLRAVRFANQLGTPNWYEPGLAQCFIPRITVSRLTYGAFPVADYYGDVKPRCILFWGHNPIVTSADGELMWPVERAVRSAEVTIAIDPRRSETARRCSHWVPLRPGTDCALALAMVNSIISDGLYDKEFVESWTQGFDELREHVKKCTPEWAEGITWVPAARIREIARLYATVKPGVLEWGVSTEQGGNTLHTVRAVAMLRGLTGNLDAPGSDIFGPSALKAYPIGRELLPAEAARKRIGAADFKLLGGSRAYLPSAHVPSLVRAMLSHEPYPVRCLLIFGSNPLTTVPNPRLFRQAMLGLDLLVVTELFMTPTAEMADYVLPAAAWPEVDSLVALPYVAELAVLCQRAALSTPEARPDEWIMDQIARRMNLPGADMDHRAIMDYQLSDLGVTFDELCQKGGVRFPMQYYKYRDKGFNTPSRKVELSCRALQRLGYDALPSFEQPPHAVAGAPPPEADYPYALITGGRRMEYFHSEGRQIPTLRKRRPDPTAEMHPDSAAAHGIADGQWVEIVTPSGSIRQKARLTEDIHPKVISVEHGWWFPEKPGPDHGVWRANANLLTSDGPPYDPAFGSCVFRGLPCRIAPAPDTES